MRLLDGLKLGVAELLWSLPRHKAPETRSKELCERLLEEGCCVVEEFLDASSVDLLVAEADRVYRNNSEYVSHESNGSDKRIYGVEALCPAFRLDSRMDAVDALSRGFYGAEKVAWFQMLGKITSDRQNLGSGSGWHRDSPFSHQFKALLYLSDVGPENGPFEYIKGSHVKRCLKDVAAFLNISQNQYRFAAENIEQLELSGVTSQRATLTGRKGTLLLVDSRGLHRGKPLQAGERLAVTRYYFPRRVPREFVAAHPLTNGQTRQQ